MSYNLSILIPTLTNRKEKLQALLGYLEPQLMPGVQLLINEDKGKKTTGHKRNELIDKAKGKYIVFIDDDDIISNDYVISLMNPIKQNQYDCICFQVLYQSKITSFPVHYSMKYKRDKNLDNKAERLPNHLMAVRKELAKKTKFKNITFGEDADYSKRLKPLLRSEFQVNKVLYTYLDYK